MMMMMAPKLSPISSVDDEESPLSPDLFFPYVTSFHSAFLSLDSNCENDDDYLNLNKIVCQGIRDLSADNQTWGPWKNSCNRSNWGLMTLQDFMQDLWPVYVAQNPHQNRTVSHQFWSLGAYAAPKSGEKKQNRWNVQKLIYSSIHNKRLFATQTKIQLDLQWTGEVPKMKWYGCSCWNQSLI